MTQNEYTVITNYIRDVSLEIKRSRIETKTVQYLDLYMKLENSLCKAREKKKI